MKTIKSQRSIGIKFLGHGPIIAKAKKTLSKDFKESSDDPDIVVVANYGRIISQKELRKTPHLNIHGSILPALRGATPIQTVIKNGLKATGYSIILMDKKVDHGPILKTGKVDIGPNDTYEDTVEKIANKSAEDLVKLIPDFLTGKIKPVAQNHQKATFTRKITDADRLIPLDLIAKNPPAAHNQIRALYAKPKAYIRLNGKRLIIHKSQIKNRRLVLGIVQLEGRKPVSWQEFLRGWRKKLPKALI